MILATLLLFFVLAPSSPAAGGADGVMELIQIQSDGIPRWYRVHVPPSYDPELPTPVVLGFHGGGGNAVQFGNSTGLAATADAHGFLLVLPEGTGLLGGAPLFKFQTWNAGMCCGSAQANGVDDLQFVSDLLDDLETRYNVDAARVYATGMSNGGLMSYGLGWFLADRITAIAPVAGSLGISASAWPPPSPPPSPVPVLAIHGLLDQNVPFAGGVGVGASGFEFPSQQQTLFPFAFTNQAGPFSFTQAQGLALRFDAVGASGADLRYWACLDGGHSWPGGPPPSWNPGEPVSASIDANEEIWAFFSGYPKAP